MQTQLLWVLVNFNSFFASVFVNLGTELWYPNWYTGFGNSLDMGLKTLKFDGSIRLVQIKFDGRVFFICLKINCFMYNIPSLNFYCQSISSVTCIYSHCLTEKLALVIQNFNKSVREITPPLVIYLKVTSKDGLWRHLYFIHWIFITFMIIRTNWRSWFLKNREFFE